MISSIPLDLQNSNCFSKSIWAAPLPLNALSITKVDSKATFVFKSLAYPQTKPFIFSSQSLAIKAYPFSNTFLLYSLKSILFDSGSANSSLYHFNASDKASILSTDKFNCSHCILFPPMPAYNQKIMASHLYVEIRYFLKDFLFLLFLTFHNTLYQYM